MIKTLAIGIPAYNEDGNIAHLLRALLKQKVKYSRLEKIIVVSDGSTDKTLELARSIKDRRIKVIDSHKRQGQNGVQNDIFKLCDQDIVVLLNADILPASTSFMNELITPIIRDSHVGLTGAKTLPLTPITTIEKMLYASQIFKNTLTSTWNGGDNILACRGAARAFSHDVYTQLRWPSTVPEDAYSYLRCKELGFKFVFCPRAQVYLRLPQTLADHIKQSHRFFNNHGRLEKLFRHPIIKKSYHIPRQLFLTQYLQALQAYPWQLSSYTFMMALIHFFLPRQKDDASRFDAATSSKKLIP